MLFVALILLVRQDATLDMRSLTLFLWRISCGSQRRRWAKSGKSRAMLTFERAMISYHRNMYSSEKVLQMSYANYQ